MPNAASTIEFALSLVDTNCDDIERGRAYAAMQDAAAEREGYFRVVDLSGDDYLYPESNFVLIDPPAQARGALLRANQNHSTTTTS